MYIHGGSVEYRAQRLFYPFSFKGRSSAELWSVKTVLEDGNGSFPGRAVQSVIWSDSGIFDLLGAQRGNEAMLEMTRYAVSLVSGRSFDSPIQMLDCILPDVIDYGRRITCPQMRVTFALNALVSLDYAAWRLYAAQEGITDFEGLIPENSRSALAGRSEKLLRVPLITYGCSDAEIIQLLESGSALLKVKIGSNPQGDNDTDKMLAWDIERVLHVKKLAERFETQYTQTGRVGLYLDANGRYPDKNGIFDLLDGLRTGGAIDDVLILEEPFPEDNLCEVSDIPLTVAADESVHTSQDVVMRSELGYSAFAMKPIAKTQSMAFKMAAEAHRRGGECFCADLTVTPQMLEWNKCFAARLPILKSMRVGLVESNGEQNYRNWNEMVNEVPKGCAEYLRLNAGCYVLDGNYYATSGGIFMQE